MSVSIDFADRTVLVSGGSSGIGLGIARRFLAAGAEVHITGTRANAEDYEHQEELKELVYHQLDVRDESAAAQLVESMPGLDVLVCCAGAVAYGGREYELPTFREIIDINLPGGVNLCVAAHERLKQSTQPAVIIIGSTSSYIATPGQPAYASSKGALVTLTKSLAQAWARDDIRVNGVAPGYVATKLTQRSFDDESVYESTIRRIPMKRWGEAEEIGDAVLFFASRMALVAITCTSSTL